MFGHQSLLVCGRPPLFGVGESIAGFSLSLPCAAAESGITGQPPSALRSTPCGSLWLSVICLAVPSNGFSSQRGWCGGAGGAQAPVDDLGLVDAEAGVVGGGEARRVADGAVDVGDRAARAAHHVVVVVVDARLVARDRAGRLDPAYESSGGQRVQRVVDGLMRD